MNDEKTHGAGESRQRLLLRQLETILRADSRIRKVQCVGSVESQTESVFSDLDLTVTVAHEFFNAIYQRDELERLLGACGLQGLFMYYSPPHWGHLCVAFFDSNIFADILFAPDKEDLEEQYMPKAPAGIEERLLETYHRFWLDCIYFSSLIGSHWNYRWEAIRGLNVLREKHLLELFFLAPGMSEIYPAFKNLPLAVSDNALLNAFIETLPTGDEPEQLRKAFASTVELFEKVYELRGGAEVSRIKPVISSIKRHLTVAPGKRNRNNFDIITRRTYSL